MNEEGLGGVADGRNVTQVAAPPVEVVETVGAGDTFNAAYLAAIAKGRHLAEALASGVAVASRAISTYPRRYA